jgi:hypothetical protein
MLRVCLRACMYLGERSGRNDEGVGWAEKWRQVLEDGVEKGHLSGYNLQVYHHVYMRMSSMGGGFAVAPGVTGGHRAVIMPVAFTPCAPPVPKPATEDPKLQTQTPSPRATRPRLLCA